MTSFGYKHTKEAKMKIGKASIGKQEKSRAWKESVGKIAIHRRIEVRYGKQNYCEICKRTDKKKYEWSNKDHKYSLKKEDWQRVCVSCHRKYDIENNNHPDNYVYGKNKD